MGELKLNAVTTGNLFSGTTFLVFSMGRCFGALKVLSSPHFHVFSYMSCVNLAQPYSKSTGCRRILQLAWQRQRKLSPPSVTVSTRVAQAAVVYGCMGILTRLDPSGSGVEVATGKIILPGSVGLAQAHPQTKNPRP